MWLLRTWIPSLVSGTSVPQEWRNDLRRSRLYSLSQLPVFLLGVFLLRSTLSPHCLHPPISTYPLSVGLCLLLSSFFSYKADVEHVCKTSFYHALDLCMSVVVMVLAAHVLSVTPHPLLLLGAFFSLLFRCLAWEGLRRESKDLFLISHSLWHICFPLSGILWLLL